MRPTQRGSATDGLTARGIWLPLPRLRSPTIISTANSASSGYGCPLYSLSRLRMHAEVSKSGSARVRKRYQHRFTCKPCCSHLLCMAS